MFAQLIRDLEREDMLVEAFGYACVDEGRVPGRLGNSPAAELKRVTGRDNLWPIDEHYESWDEDALIDAIELYGHLVATGTQDGARYHDFGDCGWHYGEFDREAGFEIYRNRVNVIIEQLGSGYALTTEGEVERFLNADLADLERSPDDTNTSSTCVDEAQIRRALHLIRSRDLDHRRDAVRILADVLEPLRPLSDQWLTKADDTALYGTANGFRIRHNDDRQRRNYDDDIWLDYLFHTYLAAVRVLQRFQAKAVAALTEQEKLTGELDGMSVFCRGDLANRLQALPLADLPDQAAFALGRSVGQRASRETVTVNQDGVEACARSRDTAVWPLEYRRGTAHGLLFDSDGQLRLHSSLASSVVQVLNCEGMPEAAVEELAQSATSTAMCPTFWATAADRIKASDALAEAAIRLPPGTVRQEWLSVAERIRERTDSRPSSHCVADSSG